MKKIKVEEVKPLVLPDYKQLCDGRFFRKNCSCTDFVYTLLLHMGYVNVTSEVNISVVSVKYKNGYINCKHLSFPDGLDCYVFYRDNPYNPYKKNTIKECISLCKVKPICILLMGLYTFNDGLYLYEGEEVTPINIIDFSVFYEL